MKKTGKVLSLFTALFMLAPGNIYLPEYDKYSAVFAEEAEFATGVYIDSEISHTSISYEKYKDHIAVTHISNGTVLPGYDIFLPDTIEGLPVTEIKGRVIDSGDIYSITLPDTVKKIDAHAFESDMDKFSNYMELVLPDSLEEVGEYAFAGLDIVSLNIGPNVKISEGAFYSNYLENIEIDPANKNYVLEDNIIYNSDKSEILATMALYGESEFTVPESVKKIGKGALNFMDVDTIFVHDNVEEIGEAAFRDIDNVYISSDNKYFEYNQGVLYSKADKRLMKAFNNQIPIEIKIKNGTEIIDPYAFYYADVYSITCPDSVTRISDHAFEQCSLRKFGFSEKTEYIGCYAFSESALTGEIELPESVNFIGDSAFSGSYITEISIPDSVNEIYYSTFANTCLSKVYMRSELLKYSRNFPDIVDFVLTDISDTITEDGSLLSADGKILYYHKYKYNEETYVIPSSVECIEKYAFLNLYKLRKIVFPEGLKKIDDSAFFGCGLNEVQIPQSVDYIGNDAFKYCDEMYSVYLPDTVSYLGNNIFESCTDLNDVKLPSGISEFPKDIFKSCRSLKSLTIPEGIERIDSSMLPPSVSELLFLSPSAVIDDSVYSDCPSLEYISGENDSEAHKFAEKYNISFVSDERFIKADLNKDGVLNVLDLIEMKEYLLSGRSQNLFFDVNSDRYANISDAVTILNQLLGIRNMYSSDLTNIRIHNYLTGFPANDGILLCTDISEFYSAFSDLFRIYNRYDECIDLYDELTDLAEKYFNQKCSVIIGSAKRSQYSRVSFQLERCSILSREIKVKANTNTYFTGGNSEGAVFLIAVPENLIKNQTLYLDTESNHSYNLPAKPVIYLYPEEETEINVKLDLDDETSLTYSYPEYPGNDGWNVTAKPDSTIYDENSREYSYLFWEAKTQKQWDMSEGFVVKGSDTVKFLQEKLEYLGLTPKEYNEFIVYWMPKMQDNNYNLISFQTKDYEDMAKLTITPEPDSIQRVFMTFKPLDEYINVKEQKLEPFERHGFSVIEWGGAELK